MCMIQPIHTDILLIIQTTQEISISRRKLFLENIFGVLRLLDRMTDGLILRYRKLFYSLDFYLI